MKRRELLKSLGALSALSFLPVVSTLPSINDVKFHFVGLGSGGTNVVSRVNEMGIKGNFSCITWFPFSDNPHKKLKHIYYGYPDELLACRETRRENIPLTYEMESLLSENSFYIIFIGLGGFTGTSIIHSVVDYLKTRGNNYLAVCSLPFNEEGRWRNDYARQRKFELANDKRVVFHDSSQITRMNANISLKDACKQADLNMIKLFKENVIELTTQSI